MKIILGILLILSVVLYGELKMKRNMHINTMGVDVLAGKSKKYSEKKGTDEFIIPIVSENTDDKTAQIDFSVISKGAYIISASDLNNYK
ncbi:MAG: hypothetical protein ABIJ97_11055 [Bacteroidota bacterium]